MKKRINNSSKIFIIILLSFLVLPFLIKLSIYDYDSYAGPLDSFIPKEQSLVLKWENWKEIKNSDIGYKRSFLDQDIRDFIDYNFDIIPQRYFGFREYIPFSAFFLTVAMIVSALISGLILSFIFFRGMKERRSKILLISLSNLITIFPLMIASSFTKTKELEKNEELEKTLKNLKEKKYFLKRRISLCLLFLIMIFFFPAFSSLLSFSAVGRVEYLLPFFVPFIIFLISFFFLKRIKKEDRGLFKLLKKNSYSKWTFLPKDNQKIYFVIISHALYVGLVILSLCLKYFI